MTVKKNGKDKEYILSESEYNKLNGVKKNKIAEWITRFGLIGLVVASLSYGLITGGVKRVLYAGERMPIVEKDVADLQEDVKDNQNEIAEFKDVLIEIKLKVDAMYQTNVPYYKKQETELILRGGESTD